MLLSLLLSLHACLSWVLKKEGMLRIHMHDTRESCLHVVPYTVALTVCTLCAQGNAPSDMVADSSFSVT